MEWFTNAVLTLFICAFIYGLVKQVQYSLLLQRTVVPNNRFNKRLLIGNHLYSFAFAGFVLLLFLNAFVYFEILPQTEQAGNAVSLIGQLFVLFMFIFKFAVIPKEPFQPLLPFKRKVRFKHHNHR